MKERLLVAEIVGPAGAGKSTLAHVLRQHDGALRSNLSLWDLPLHLLALNVFRSAPVLLAWSMAARCLRWDQIKQIVRLSALCQILRGRASPDNRTLILDEGGVFGLAKLFAFPGNVQLNAKWSQTLVEGWAKTLDLVIWLDAPDAVLAERIRARSKTHRMKNGTDQEIYEFLARYRRSYSRVISALTADRGPEVLMFVTDEKPVEQIASEILAAASSSRRCQQLV